LDTRPVFFFDEHEPAPISALASIDLDNHEHIEERIVLDQLSHQAFLLGDPSLGFAHVRLLCPVT
jgi:hypothetical protein